MMNDPLDRDARTIAALLVDLFEINAVYRQHEDLVFSLAYRFAPMRSRDALTERLKTGGYRFDLTRSDEGLLLRINPTPRLRIPVLNIVMFAITLLTIYVVPVWFRNILGGAAHPLDATLQDLARGAGLQFTVAMMSILLVHEMGHFVASRRRKIVTSWPYFIPAPNIIGTFGAIIKSKSPFLNRRDLIEVGSAGPIAGWIVALGWLIYGLSQSGYFPAAAFSAKDMIFSLDGESLLMRFATLGILGSAPHGEFLKLTEAAFAGWVGLLVTAINMLPIGQLDGGHVLYGLFRRMQHYLGMLGMAALVVLGFQSALWWVFAAVGLFFGIKHPPTLQDDLDPPPVAKAMGWAALVIMVLSFTPVPFR